MRIASYLQKIALGQTVNFDVLRQQLEARGYDPKTILNSFNVEKLGRSKNYRVTVLEPAFFAELSASFPDIKVIDRETASQEGDSHRCSVSRSIIVMYPSQQSHPIVVLNDRHGFHTPVKLAKRLLIIENQENFVRKQECIAFLQQQFVDFSEQDLDIALGFGNSVSNKLNEGFLNHYHELNCLFDLDLGGLQTFANLAELTNHPNLSFLLPPCAKSLMKSADGERKIRWQLREEQLAPLGELLRRTPQLRPVINLIVEQKMMLEQELYL
ncbi:hypothetical protein A9Q80_01695 [Cycloclasticus sp. 46_83_sub15_T18]|nr:hypothetical protein A9Q80_01695 [Cycloclasticus sp. 46_83_sub15_T18]OUR83450.1 hypothetical protein A9Q82_01825 [Cycloclasticus sp. 46_120_T64]